VDREGEYAFTLRPRTEKYPARLLCEVKVVDNVKIVTIRSTYLVENSTLYPLELMLVDEHGQPAYSLERIVPGQDFALPVEVASKYRIRLQPDRQYITLISLPGFSPFPRGLWLPMVFSYQVGRPCRSEELCHQVCPRRFQRSSISVPSLGPNRRSRSRSRVFRSILTLSSTDNSAQ
jgi:hypothetical protein